MNEIKRIHLGRQPFVVSVDAYKDLRDYLDAIKQAVGADHKEVVEEVELRMAELLTERGVTGEKAIVASDIEYLQAQLGNPTDFAEDADEAVVEARKLSAETKSKRLFRDTNNGMVAGVSSGLAAYFGIDAIIVRIAFIVLTIFWGWGAILYLLLWVIVPEAKTASERLQMQGKPVTVDSLKELAVEADVAGAAKRVSQGVSPIIQKLGIVIAVCVGLGFMFVGLMMLLGVTASVGYGVLYQDNIFKFAEFALSSRDIFFAFAVFIAIASVAVGLILTGISAIRRRWLVPGWATASLLAAFFVATVAATLMGPGVVDKMQQYADDIHHRKTVYVADYTKLEIVGDTKDDRPLMYDYVVADKQSQGYAIELSYMGEPNVKNIKTTVTDGVLRIDTTAFSNDPRCHGLCLIDSYGMKLKITGPALESVSIDGDQGVRLEVPEGLTQDALTVRVSNGALFGMSGVLADTVDITSMRESDMTTAVLTGLQKQRDYSYTIRINDDTSYITRTNQLNIQTDETCRMDTALPIVELDEEPQNGVTARGSTSDKGLACVKINPPADMEYLNYN